jgi:hypothetical protein
MSDIEELPTWVRDNQAYHVAFDKALDDSEAGVQVERPTKANIGGTANTISSRHIEYPDRHKVMLDLDVPHKLIPSSTEGHSHLYLDVELCKEDYRDLLVALRTAGIIQKGILDQFDEHGATFLRLPTVKKDSRGQLPW